LRRETRNPLSLPRRCVSEQSDIMTRRQLACELIDTSREPVARWIRELGGKDQDVQGRLLAGRFLLRGLPGASIGILKSTGVRLASLRVWNGPLACRSPPGTFSGESRPRPQQPVLPLAIQLERAQVASRRLRGRKSARVAGAQPPAGAPAGAALGNLCVNRRAASASPRKIPVMKATR
jgi:hypothetical protein